MTDQPTPDSGLPTVPEAQPGVHAAVSKGSGRRTAVIAGVTAATLVVLAGFGYTAVRVLSGGKDAATGLPSTTLAEISIDLDPGASQKIEAIKTLQKFPSLRKSLDMQSGDDLRKRFFKSLPAACKSINYENDIKPWIGTTVSFGIVPVDGKIAPVMSLGVSDTDKAKVGIKKVLDCSKSTDTGIAFQDKFAIVSDSNAHATAIAAAIGQKTLADESGFSDWTKAAGGSGVLNLYVSPSIRDHLSELSKLDSKTSSLSAADTKALKEFKGAAGALRFNDGGMEFEFAGGGVNNFTSSKAGGTVTSSLPADTAAAVGFSVPKASVNDLLDNLAKTGFDVEPSLAQVGLTKADVLDILDNGIGVAVDGDAPNSVADISSPDQFPIAIVVPGSSAKLKGLVDKLAGMSGQSADQMGLIAKDAGGKGILTFDSAYASKLEKSSGLGKSEPFTSVVPHGADASTVFYVNFNSRWIDTFTSTMTGSQKSEFTANLSPLRAFGFSTWQDGSTSHAMVKLTTD